jgi:flavodoxin
MHTAVVYFYKNKKNQLEKLAKGIAKGIQAQGHQADVVDGNIDSDKRMFIYKYIVFGVETTAMFGGKLPESMERFLKNSGNLGGKRSCAFATKKSLGSPVTLRKLMKAMEGEGMFITYSDIIKSDLIAEEIGKILKIERK